MFNILAILILIVIMFLLMKVIVVLAGFIEEKEIEPTEYEEAELLFFGGEEDW